MIEVKFFYNDDELYGFSVSNHGSRRVCAAVSALTINTVNAVEAFADVICTCEAKKDGYIFFECNALNHDVSLLLKTLRLGIITISNEYKNSIRIKEVRQCSK